MDAIKEHIANMSKPNSLKRGMEDRECCHTTKGCSPMMLTSPSIGVVGHSDDRAYKN